MKNKTFKIGEYAIGGIVHVSVSNEVVITCKDWNTKQVVERRTFQAGSKIDLPSIEIYLCCDVTSSYYAGKIMNFIKQANQPRVIIGYQVTNDLCEILPEMDASFCVYSKSQCKKMLSETEANDPSQFSICPIFEGDIENPTMMFGGNPDK